MALVSLLGLKPEEKVCAEVPDLVNVLVTQVRDLNVDEVYPIVLESEMEGFRFLRRFYDEYACGTNRFDRDGEI